MKAKPSLLRPLLALVLAALHSSPAAGQREVVDMPPAVTSERFSFSADDLSLKQALALFARANRLNIVPDLDIEGRVTVEFHDLPLDLAMQALLEANGYYFTHEGPLIRVRNQETRLFQIDYINATRVGQGSNAVQISSSSGGSNSGGGSGGGGSGGGSGNEGSMMTVTNTSTIDFWGGLGDQLESMLSETGTFTINSLAGTVLVRDAHRRVETVARYIEEISGSITRQIDLEVEIYEITLGDSSQLGINWERISDNLNVSTFPGSFGLPSGAGLIISNPVYGDAPSPPAGRAVYQNGRTTAVIDALKQEGELKIVSKPRLRTLNNQPAVVRVGQDLPIFTREVTISPGDEPILTETESVQTITVGTVLSITPQVSADGIITLDVTPAVSRLVRTARSASQNTEAPVIDIRQASSIVRLRDGATIVMGGLVQDSSTSSRRKVPVLGDIPLLGKAFTGTYERKERTELIFFLTPRIIRDAVNPPPPAVASVAHEIVVENEQP